MQTLKIFVDTWLGLEVEPHGLLLSQMALRAIVVFVAALAMLRLAHKRFFARRNTIDVLLTFVLASTLARAINGSAAFFPTLATGFVLVFVHRGFTFLGARWPAFGRLAKGEPATLIENGRVQKKPSARTRSAATISSRICGSAVSPIRAKSVRRCSNATARSRCSSADPAPASPPPARPPLRRKTGFRFQRRVLRSRASVVTA